MKILPRPILQGCDVYILFFSISDDKFSHVADVIVIKVARRLTKITESERVYINTTDTGDTPKQ